jgi:hypothetical protein
LSATVGSSLVKATSETGRNWSAIGDLVGGVIGGYQKSMTGSSGKHETRSPRPRLSTANLLESLLPSCEALLVVADLAQLSFYLRYLIFAHSGSHWRRVVQVRVLPCDGLWKIGTCRKYLRN